VVRQLELITDHPIFPLCETVGQGEGSR